MSGITSTLSIAKTAIAAQQYGLNITGQNIANVNNPDYSVQNADQQSLKPTLYGGYLFGTGVDTTQVTQSVNQLIEDRLTSELGTQASFEEQESYMLVLESFFDESSANSITSSLTDFWNSWQDLSDNPEGSSERIAVLEYGKNLSETFESVLTDIDGLATDITLDINSAIVQINALTKQIAKLNQEIASLEATRTANDLRDQRNGLVDELGQLIEINTFEDDDGNLSINVANGLSIVSGIDTHEIKQYNGKIVWVDSAGGQNDISDRITSGSLAGFLEIRDSVIPKYEAEINILAREMIWAINYQASQGVGLEYYSEAVTGEYTTDESGWLTSFDFGDKIDYSKDFVMWMEDSSSADTAYSKIQIDMGISEARISNFQGSTPGHSEGIYRLTVVDEAVLGDKVVTESDGDGLATVQSSTGDVATTLNAAIAEQTLYVYGGASGTGVIDIKDIGGEANRSAASIAQALNQVDGVEAYASENSADFDVSGIVNAQDGDEIKYSIYVDGVVSERSFFVDSEKGTVQQQFEDSLLEAAEALNTIYEDDDLFVDGLSMTSQSGRTLGIQDFEVQDNAGIRLNTFQNFDDGDKVTFNIDSMTAPGTAYASTTAVTVDLTGVDTTDEAQVCLAFSTALSTALSGKEFSVEHDPSTNSVVIRTTDGSGIRLRDGANDTDDNAVVTVSQLGGTNTTAASADTQLRFNNVADASDAVRYDAITLDTDTVVFSGQGTDATISESTAGGGDKSAAITGTVSVLLEEGMSMRSSVFGAGTGGLFDTQYANQGSSILTLGGDGGFSGISTTAAGETISFTLDGTNVTFAATAATGPTDIELAILFENEIEAALAGAGVSQDYQVVRTGSSVSILKAADLEDPIVISNFSDTVGNKATVKVRTGTATGTNQPQNDVLSSGDTYRDTVTSSLYDDEGVIMWERLDADGYSTGAHGYVTVEDEGNVVITENGAQTISFDISKGSLVAGNTLTVNTDTAGRPDPLDLEISGRANSINDLYQFEVVSGGKVGELPGTDEEPLVIKWSNSVSSGTFTIEGHDPPMTPEVPVEVTVDGMNMKFYSGTLLDGDVFVVETGDTGIPVFTDSEGNATGQTMSDWHWTLDSFADEFNRNGQGLTAVTTVDNRLSFQASDEYYAVENVEYSGENGFNEVNATIDIKDWSVIDFAAADLRFTRSSDGSWGVMNDPTGGNLQMIPADGDDDGFGVDFNGDGLADLEIKFENRVSGDGYLEFDFSKHNANDIGFAFSDDASSSSGLLAAAGINTFFTGSDAYTMDVDEDLSDTKFITAATIDSETGEISLGDNTNALALADVQYLNITMSTWTYTRGSEATSSRVDTTLDDYYTRMISSMGIQSRSIKSSKEYADIMVSNITQQRDSISAVSLDEEMIKLMKYQHAFSAASKLITVSDEMLNTLISMR